MRTIAIINQKGGVGKTTTAVNLSAALAECGQRVCLVDLDPQAHASLHLGFDARASSVTIYDVLTSETPLAEAAVAVEPNLLLVGSHIDLAAVEVELAGEVGRELILRDRMTGIEDHCDWLIVDCPPSLGILTLNALCAVREVILPLQPHFLALHGLSKLLETIDLVARRLNPGLRLSGVVLCLYESGTRLAAEIARDAEAFFEAAAGQGKPWSAARVFGVPIRRNIRLAEAPSFSQTIFQYAPTSHGAADYRQLAREILQNETAHAAPGSARAGRADRPNRVGARV